MIPQLEKLKRGQIIVEKKALIEHCNILRKALNAIDKIMLEKESNQRGKKIAKVCNAINYSLDMIEFFQLNKPF